MKRCPKCNSLFPEIEQFCEVDGTPLVSEAGSAVSDPNIQRPRRASSNTVLLLIALAGIVLGALLFLTYLALTRKTENANQSNSNSPVAQQQIPSALMTPFPRATTSPSLEPSPSPSTEPSPSPQSTAPPIELSSNPVSTAVGARKTGPVIIRLDTGVKIEAEEAWQTGEGIWYRQGSDVSLVDPKHVKSIEKVPPPSPQPTASTATPKPN